MRSHNSILFLILCIPLLFCGCRNRSGEGAVEYYQTQGEVFSTFYHIKYKYNRSLGKEIRECLGRVDRSLNPFNPESVIARVNRNEEVEVDDLFIKVFDKAREVSEISGGSYDITAAPLINLWGFGFDKMEEATPEVIDSLKEFVGYKKIKLEGRRVFKEDPRILLNASSLAKGFACDVIADRLDSLHISDYMIEIGGEICARGKNPDGSYWRIQVNKPIDDETGIINERMEVVELRDRSMATSGNYRKFYIKEGKKYGHTIDPVSGYPAQSNILSATVFYPDCMTADAFATAFLTMNLEKAVAIGEQFPEMKYLFIYTDPESGELKIKKN